MTSTESSQTADLRLATQGADCPIAGTGVPLEDCAAKKSLARIRHDINNTMLALVTTAELLSLDESLTPGTRQTVAQLLAAVHELRGNVRELSRYESSAELKSATNESAALDALSHPRA